MSDEPDIHANRSAAPTFFLPDFCAAPTVLAVVLIAELVAIALALARQSLVTSFWIDLAASSMFLLWLGLGCTAVLCQCRPWLARLSTPWTITAALALLTLTV